PVSHVTGLGGTPVVTPYPVGAEPTAVAVTPYGTYVFVANDNDDSLTRITTADGSATTFPVGPEPRALAVTRGADDDDLETVYVTLMFGQAVGGSTPSEGNDTGRQGVVQQLVTGDGHFAGPDIALAPVPD